MKRSLARAALVVGLLLAVPGLLLATLAAAASPPPPDAFTRSLITELTGQIPHKTAVSPDCVYSPEYGLYLCPEPKPTHVAPRDPAAARQARRLLGGPGLLLVADSTNDRIMAFDAATGDLVDANFIPTDLTNLDFPINAILSPAGDSVLVSDLNEDLVQAYDFDGNYVGSFAPAGGVNTAVLENPRGIALRPNGNLLVPIGAGGNQDAVAEFNAGGSYLGQFIAAASGGLDSPYDVYRRANDWLVGKNSSSTYDALLRFDTSGAFLNDFAVVDGLPQQIAQAANDNVLLANFSLNQRGVLEFLPDGTLIGTYNPIDESPRGVYELPNGNLLVTMGTSPNGGVYEIDRNQNVVSTKTVGTLTPRYIEFVQVPGLPNPALALTKTVHADMTSCAPTNTFTVTLGTAVNYCYTVENSGNVTFTLHQLVDSKLGDLLVDFPLNLAPGESTQVSQTAVLTQTTVNTATWTASDGAYTTTATALATVTVINPAIALTKTAGTDPDACATTNTLTVTAGTGVVYCYMVTNTGDMTFTHQTLIDSALGVLLLNEPLTLAPAESYAFTATAVLTQTTTNTATWTAWAAPWSAAAQATATVTVVPNRIYLPAVVSAEN